MTGVEELTLLEEGKQIQEGFLQSLVGQRVLMKHYISKEPVESLLMDGDKEDVFSIRKFKGILFEAFGRREFHDNQDGKDHPGICTTTWREKNGILTQYYTTFIFEVKTDSELFHDEYIIYHKHDQQLIEVKL